jgi:putative flippase GtrA
VDETSVGEKTRRMLAELLRFLAVGGIATAVSFLGFNALVHGALTGVAPMKDRPVAAYIMVNAVAGVVAYAGMRVWAFRHRQVRDAVSSVVSFFVLGAMTMTVPVVCLMVSRSVLGLSTVWADNISANVVGLGLGTALRFWVFRRFVFLAAIPTVAGPGQT